MDVARRALTAGWTAARRHSRNATIMVGVLAFALAANGARSGDASGGRTVTARGSDQFVPNTKIMSTLHFSPGNITMGSGQTLTFTNDTSDPHTLSIVDGADVPADVDAVFNCGSPATVCDEVFGLFGAEP